RPDSALAYVPYRGVAVRELGRYLSVGLSATAPAEVLYLPSARSAVVDHLGACPLERQAAWADDGVRVRHLCRVFRHDPAVSKGGVGATPLCCGRRRREYSCSDPRAGPADGLVSCDDLPTASPAMDLPRLPPRGHPRYRAHRLARR